VGRRRRCRCEGWYRTDNRAEGALHWPPTLSRTAICNDQLKSDFPSLKPPETWYNMGNRPSRWKVARTRLQYPNSSPWRHPLLQPLHKVTTVTANASLLSDTNFFCHGMKSTYTIGLRFNKMRYRIISNRSCSTEKRVMRTIVARKKSPEAHLK
jgi:hypothetical protein